MVITSTIGNRVAVMSGTWVQIPPSPPNKKRVLYVLFFVCVNKGDLNPKRAKSVKKNMPVACFLAFSCADRYRKSKILGGLAGRIACNTYPTVSAKQKRVLYVLFFAFYITEMLIVLSTNLYYDKI